MDEHKHITAQDRFLCRVGMCPLNGPADAILKLGIRYTFWVTVHNLAERLWHWTYESRLRPSHEGRPPLLRSEMRHKAFTKYSVYAYEYHYLVYIASNCARCPQQAAPVIVKRGA